MLGSIKGILPTTSDRIDDDDDDDICFIIFQSTPNEMTLVRKPQPLRTLKINESRMKRWPMALLTIVVVRRSFVGLLLGTLLINLSQRKAPSVLYPSRSHNDLLSTMSNNTGSIPSNGSGSIPEQNQQLPSVLEQMFSSDNEESKREVMRVNATLREYAGSVPWMERHHFLPAVGDVPDEHRICFVHVGKTAGSTMACYLGFQYPVCNDRMYKLPGRLPQWTTNLMHTHYDNCQYEHINLFLFTLRDPVARMQSWFRYEYPKEDDSSASKGVLFVDCGFRSLEELAGSRGLGAMGRTLCSRRAWWAIRGTVGFKKHNMYNFGYYYNRTNLQDPNARIAAIRTEYMQQDWIGVEERLFGTSPCGTSPCSSASTHNNGFGQKNKSSARAANRTDVKASSALTNLCRGLCEEIQVYKEILHRAENLRPDEIAQSMDELSAQCPTEAQLSQCPALEGRLTEQPEGPEYSYAQHP